MTKMAGLVIIVEVGVAIFYEYRYYKDIPNVHSDTRSVCAIEGGYRIDDTFSFNYADPNVVPGDVLKYVFFMSHNVNFNMNCATDPLDTHGSSTISFSSSANHGNEWLTALHKQVALIHEGMDSVAFSMALINSGDLCRSVLKSAL